MTERRWCKQVNAIVKKLKAKDKVRVLPQRAAGMKEMLRPGGRGVMVYGEALVMVALVTRGQLS